MQIKICDVCEDRNRDAERICFMVDREMDPAGSMVDNFESFDLCDKCQISVYIVAIVKAVTDNYARGKLLADCAKELKNADKNEVVG